MPPLPEKSFIIIFNEKSMKTKILFLLFAISITFSTVNQAQIIEPHGDYSAIEAEYNQRIQTYLKKSKTQRISGWALLGGGLVLMGSSDAIFRTPGRDPGSLNMVAVGNGIGFAAIVASAPVLYMASGNKYKTKQLNYAMLVDLASSESEKELNLSKAAEYFQYRAKVNTNTGIVLSSIGGAAMIGALVWPKQDNHGSWIDDMGEFIGRVLVFTGGTTLAVISIPFYMRGAQLNKTAKAIVHTGRIPQLSYNTVVPIVGGGQIVSVGIGFPIGY